jgi:uncharacterized integral membrane protein
MSKKQIWALVLIGLCAVVLVWNRGAVSVDLVFTTVTAMKGLVFLGCIAVGVIIGILLR